MLTFLLQLNQEELFMLLRFSDVSWNVRVLEDEKHRISSLMKTWI